MRRVGIAFAGTLTAVLLVAAPAAAECTYLPPWPHVTTAIPSARLIVVGDVVTDFNQADLHLGPDQGARHYALRVTEVLRGNAKVGDLRDIEWILPNWPQSWLRGLTASCTSLRAVPGEVLALAYDALEPGGPMRLGRNHWIQPPTRYNAVGVIKDLSPPDGVLFERQHVTIEQVRALAALPQTDALASHQDSASPLDLALLLLAASVGAAAWFRRRNHGDDVLRPTVLH